jgi:hypothetical protein
MCVLSVLMAPSMVIRYNMGWYEMLLIDVPLFFAATASVANFYMVCQRELHVDWMTRLKYLPFLMSIGIGLTVNNTKAVFEALFNKQSEFARTPKYRIEAGSDEWIGKKYRQNFVVQPIIELALGLYFTPPCSTRSPTGSSARCRSWCSSRSGSSTPACFRSSSSTLATTPST